MAKWSRVICGPQLLRAMLESAPALEFADWGLYDVRPDGLIEVNHFEVYNQTERDWDTTAEFIREVEKIRERAGEKYAVKYEPSCENSHQTQSWFEPQKREYMQR